MDNKNNLPINRYIMELKGLLLNLLNDLDVDVFLFGSWARGTQKHSSDVDIGIDAHGKDISYQLALLREEIEESAVPYNVDIVDMNNASEAICASIRREGILWKRERNARF